MITETRAKWLLALTALFWSSGGILIKWVSAGPLVVAGVRSLIAGLALWAFYRPKLFPLRAPQLAVAVTYALTVISFVAATKWTSAANAILLQSTAPVYVALFGTVFLGEKIRWLDIATILTVFVGMLFFFGDELSLEGFRGNLLGLFSGFTFAWFILLTRKFSGEDSVGMIILGNLLAAVLTLPFTLGGPALTAADLGGLLVLGIIQLALPYALYSRAIPHVRAIDAVLIVLIEPVLNPIWVFLFLGEKPGAWALIGGLIVLGAVTVRSILIAREVRSRARRT